MLRAGKKWINTENEDTMDSEKCDVLLNVLESGSLTAAAEKLGYTASGISRVIAAMEKDAGFPLLTRSREGVTATRECEELLPAVRELSYWGRYYHEQTRSIRGVESGTVLVGSVYSAFYPWLSEMIAGFSKEHPGIRIEVVEGTSSEMAAAVEEKRADFCIISRREGSFRFIPLLLDEAVVILPKNHPLALQDPPAAFPVSRFEEEPFIQLYPNRESDTSLFLEKHKLSLNVRLSTEDHFAGYAMVEAGLGISLENAVTAQQLADRVAVLSLEPRELIEIGIALPDKKVISPAAAAFAAYALKRLPQSTP